MTNIIQHPSSGVFRTSLGHSVRSGESSYRQLESLYAENRLPVSSVVVDASKANYQREFIDTLSKDGVEILLDTKCAELSSEGLFEGYAKGAPWSIQDESRPLAISDFQTGTNTSVFGSIARFATELGVNAVYAPTHFLRDGAFDPLFEVDIASLLHLRRQLDFERSEYIAIDYALLMPNRLFQDEAHQKKIIQKLAGLPFDNLVIRLSGFGSHVGHLTMKRTFRALNTMKALKKPIVIDHVGGLVALGAVAFNYASGTVHGIGERECFNTSSWYKRRQPKGNGVGFGRAQYIPLPGLDCTFKKKELELIARSPRERRKLMCHDRDCCGSKGLAYLDNPKAHIARGADKALNMLSEVPNIHRASHFMNTDIRSAERKARDLASVQTSDESLNNRLEKAGKRIDSLSRTFDTLIDESSREEPPQPIHRRTRYRRSA